MEFKVLYGFYKSCKIMLITGSILYFSCWRIKGKKLRRAWRCVVIKKIFIDKH